MTPTLSLALDVISLGQAVLKMSPPLQRDEPENTYGLPRGLPIFRKLRGFFKHQRAFTLSQISPYAPIPVVFHSLADYNDPMASAMTPILRGYWDASGKETRVNLGLDPDEWRVTDPHLAEKIHTAAFDFCQATNDTTSKSLDTALQELRRELHEGIVTEGESVDLLTKRVMGVYENASKGRARRITATEASRAVHAAQYQSAADSGVCVGMEVLISGDACSLCVRIYEQANKVRFGQPFAVIGDHPSYENIYTAPFHPLCACTTLPILSPEYGGPENVDWAETLIQPQKDLDEYVPPKNPPKPEPERAAKPTPIKPQTPEAVPIPYAAPTPVAPAPTPLPAPEPLPERIPVVSLPVPPIEPNPAYPPLPLPPLLPDDASPKDKAVRHAERLAAQHGIKTVPIDLDETARRTRRGKTGAAQVDGFFDPNDGKIYFNRDGPAWADPNNLPNAHKAGWYSSGDSMHIAHHEIGHVLHERNVTDARFNQELNKTQLTPKQKFLVQKHVSHYAATKPKEMVAETYAGMMAGKTYPDDVMDLYFKFGGPLA